jgi:hypothetical protein
MWASAGILGAGELGLWRILAFAAYILQAILIV